MIYQGYDTDKCFAPVCPERAATEVLKGLISLPLREAVLGDAGTDPRIQFVAVCRKHYRQLHRRDGVTLGYRKVDGKVRAYIKEEHW
jgi:hypothetical protein